MGPAEAQVAANEERRRSERLPLALPVVVRGESLDANSFQEETFTLSVSAHGALLALVTTVTLGQSLLLRNPQTQDEAMAWVTRLGLPRSGLAQVGVEFVRPDAAFWSNKSRVKSPDRLERRAEEGIRVLPQPEPKVDVQATPSDRSEPGPQTQTNLSDMRTPATLASPDLLLSALEQTLRQAADQAVAAAATARLGAAVNQAAAVIQHFSKARVQQFEDRLVQYREELVSSARNDFLVHLQAYVARTEEHLRKRAEEFIEDAARNAHSDFADRMRETVNRAAVDFVEHANNSSAQYSARLAEEAKVATVEARLEIERFRESEKKVWSEMERAVAQTQQRAESLTSQLNEAHEACESLLRVFQEKLAHAKEQEVERFRERLRNVLATLLASLIE
jgi:hypothetical protein